MSYTNLVEHIAKSIVAEPESVEVEEIHEQDGLTYYINVAPSDVGKLIGKNGRVITAIRYFVSAVAAKQRRRAFVRVKTD